MSAVPGAAGPVGLDPPAPQVVAAPARPVVARRHPPRDYAMRRLLAAADALALAIGIGVIARVTVAGGHLDPDHLLVALVTIPLFVVVFKTYGLYDRDARRLSHSTLDDVPWLVHALLTGTVGLWVVLRLTGDERTAFGAMLLFAAVALVGSLILRALARRVLPLTLGPERVLLVGDGPEIPALVRKMRAHPEYAVEPVALVTRSGAAPDGCDLPVLASVRELDLERAAFERRIERVIVARLDGPPPAADARGETLDANRDGRLEIMRACKELCLKVSVVPQLFDAMGSSVVVDDVEGITLLGVNPPVLSRSSRALKRGMDVAAAGVALVLFAVPCAIVAIAIRLDSPGPVFFRQRRIGLHGEPFSIVKFRTMRVGAEAEQAALRRASSDPGWLLLEHDPRVTRIGGLLRRTSVDELPQLWNILRGDMSLVGPRPLIESEDSQLSGWRRRRVDLKPGLTGLWQILGRTDIPFEEMVKLDYLYVTNWSLWSDVRLVLRTIPVVVRRSGAN